MSTQTKKKEFEESIDKMAEKILSDSNFEIINYLRNFAAIVNEYPLTLKEMELLIQYHKVPEEELGVELPDPIHESCFLCDELFEKGHLNVVSIPFCCHRAHLDCLRKVNKVYCSYCGNGVRSALFSSLRGRIMSMIAQTEAKAQQHVAEITYLPDMMDALRDTTLTMGIIEGVDQTPLLDQETKE